MRQRDGMATPYELLEQIAAGVAPHVSGSDAIVHVEVDFDRQPFDLRFQSTPYDQNTLFDLKLRIMNAVPASLVMQVRNTAKEYFEQVQPLMEQDLIFLRVSVTSDGNFRMAQSCRERHSKS
jgi:hypothetical protein